MGNRPSLLTAIHRRTSATLNAVISEVVKNPQTQEDTTPSERDNRSRKATHTIVDIDLLHPFHTADIGFLPYDDESLKSLAKSIETDGLLNVIQVRPEAHGNGYEILAGHNRWKACKSLGWKVIPVEVHDVGDDRAIRIAIITNIKQRHYLRPSERALAYRAFMDTMKHQGSRTDLLEFLDDEDIAKLKPGMTTRDQIAVIYDVDRNSVQRHLRLSYLIRPLLYMVDEKKIPFMTGVNISYYSEEIQNAILEEIEQKNRPIMTYEMSKTLRSVCPAKTADLASFMEAWDKLETGEYSQPAKSEPALENPANGAQETYSDQESSNNSDACEQPSGQAAEMHDDDTYIVQQNEGSHEEQDVAHHPENSASECADMAQAQDVNRTTIYNKLVRDRIPEVIKADGCTCECKILSDDDFQSALLTKLREECDELINNPCLEEFADVY